MLAARLVSRVCRNVGRRASFIGASTKAHVPIGSNQLQPLTRISRNEPIANQASLLDNFFLNPSVLQIHGISSHASPEHDEKGRGNAAASDGTEPTKTAGEEESESTKASGEKESLGEGNATDQAQESDSASESNEELSRDDLVKLVAEKEELVKVKHQEIERMKDKVLRTYAEMENIMNRTKREAENSKKFAIQNFAKGLLDVADNLERASSVVKDSFSKIDSSKDTSGVVPLLKTLLEGVEMTEKHLADVFKKFGVEKFDSLDEPFDPNRHYAVFQIPDPSKPPSTVAQILKSGYMLYDRVIRPAEVGVTTAVENKEGEKGCGA